MPGLPAFHGYPPWGAAKTSLSEIPKELAPQETFVFHCERGECPHTPLPRSYAAGAKVPWAVDCRCGRPARRDGAPPDAMPFTPHYGQFSGHRRDVPPTDEMRTDPMGQLRKRRSDEDGEQILAERMAEVRESGLAR